MNQNETFFRFNNLTGFLFVISPQSQEIRCAAQTIQQLLMRDYYSIDYEAQQVLIKVLVESQLSVVCRQEGTVSVKMS